MTLIAAEAERSQAVLRDVAERAAKRVRQQVRWDLYQYEFCAEPGSKFTQPRER